MFFASAMSGHQLWQCRLDSCHLVCEQGVGPVLLSSSGMRFLLLDCVREMKALGPRDVVRAFRLCRAWSGFSTAEVVFQLEVCEWSDEQIGLDLATPVDNGLRLVHWVLSYYAGLLSHQADLPVGFRALSPQQFFKFVSQESSVRVSQLPSGSLHLLEELLPTVVEVVLAPGDWLSYAR